MKLALRLFLICITLVFATASFSLNLQKIKQIYIFGDSLSDGGYLDNSHHFLPKGKQPTYTSLHGHVWGYYLAKSLGVPFSVNNLNPPANNKWVSGKLSGNNYAAGGARAPADVMGFAYKPDYNPPSLQWQIKQFLQQHHHVAPKNAVYFIWIGANDILLPTLQKHAFKTLESIDNSVTTTVKEVKLLQTAGAKHIVIINVPPVGDAPLMNDTFLSRWIGNMLTDHYNNKLKSTLQSEHLNIPIFDANGIFKRVYNTVKTKGAFHFKNISITNVTDSACLPHHYMKKKTNIAINCVAPKSIPIASYMFADLVHPSNSGHIILAYYLREFLKNLPS